MINIKKDKTQLKVLFELCIRFIDCILSIVLCNDKMQSILNKPYSIQCIQNIMKILISKKAQVIASETDYQKRTMLRHGKY